MPGRRHSLAVAAAALLAGCVHAPPPFRSTPLHVERRGTGALAYAEAEVGGRSIRLLVDTGAPYSLLPASFARGLALRTGTDAFSATLIDANGREVTLKELPGVPVRFPGAGGPAPVDFHMDTSGLSPHGVLAPQALLAPGWAMTLDLERGELRYDPEPEALARLAERRGAGLPEVAFRGCVHEGLFSRAHRVVPASVNGVPVEMLVDSGAEITALARNNPALPSLAAAEGQRGLVRGIHSDGQSLVLDGVPVEVAGGRFAGTVMVVPASARCWDGAIGADLLRSCAVVWGWSRLWMACGPPAQGAAPASAGPRRPEPSGG